MIALVVAMAENGVIGCDNQLPWHLPADLRHFKQLTLGHPIVMGRRTFESIGKPLPGRTSVVITRQQDWQAGEGVQVVHSVMGAIEAAQQLHPDIFIIGGAEIYRQALPAADTVYLTEVHQQVDGDAVLPPFQPELWREESRERHEADDRHAHAYSFVTLRRH